MKKITKFTMYLLWGLLVGLIIQASIAIYIEYVDLDIESFSGAALSLVSSYVIIEVLGVGVLSYFLLKRFDWKFTLGPFLNSIGFAYGFLTLFVYIGDFLVPYVYYISKTAAFLYILWFLLINKRVRKHEKS